MASNSELKAKFRGCLIGGLLGDCVGLPCVNMKFEMEADGLVGRKILGDFINDLMGEEHVKELHHTDDTRMTISVATSLAEKGEVNAKDLTEKFVMDFFDQPYRGYGTHVQHVFEALKKSNFEDIYLPAKLQFSGEGSFGNGAAMRIAPLALFGNSRGEAFIMNGAKECSLMTHTHVDGYNGAILQCLAVNLAFGLDPSKELDPVWFINTLIEKMENIETAEIKPYCESLKKMKEYFLPKQKDVSSKEIAENLGNGADISALKSVPPAIYSFLRGMKPIKDYFESSNPFMRTIYFAISLGGDTDTIGCMAGSIAGAYYGEDVIPKVLQKKCESIEDIISLADRLFEAAYAK